MSWLDIFRDAYETIQVGGVALVKRRTLNFVAGISAVDNPTTGATDVTGVGREVMRFNVPGLMVNGVTVYIGNGVSNNSSVKSSRPVPISTTYTSIRVKLLTAPSGANSTVFTVMLDDVATTITITIAGTSTTGVATFAPVTFTAGQTVSIRGVPNASVDNATTAPDIVLF